MAWDARDHILAAANNANITPFMTLVNTDKHQILGQIIFDKAHGVDAQNGIEQPQWSPQTGLFYVSVPQVGPDPAQGGVAVIDPSSMHVTAVFPVVNCSPAGLALGPNHQAVIGCGASFPVTPPSGRLPQPRHSSSASTMATSSLTSPMQAATTRYGSIPPRSIITSLPAAR